MKKNQNQKNHITFFFSISVISTSINVCIGVGAIMIIRKVWSPTSMLLYLVLHFLCHLEVFGGPDSTWHQNNIVMYINGRYKVQLLDHCWLPHSPRIYHFTQYLIDSECNPKKVNSSIYFKLNEAQASDTRFHTNNYFHH